RAATHRHRQAPEVQAPPALLGGPDQAGRLTGVHPPSRTGGRNARQTTRSNPQFEGGGQPGVETHAGPRVPTPSSEGWVRESGAGSGAHGLGGFWAVTVQKTMRAMLPLRPSVG